MKEFVQETSLVNNLLFVYYAFIKENKGLYTEELLLRVH